MKNELERIEDIIQSVLKRYEHKSPSPETIRRLTAFEEAIKQLGQDLKDHYKKDMDEFERLHAKLDSLNDRLNPESENYMFKEVKDVLDAYRGGKLFGEIIKWLASVGLAWLALKGLFK